MVMQGGMLAADLERRFGRPGALSFSVSPLGGVVAHLSRGDCGATIALFGAHVLSWTAAGREQLWLSPAARLDSGRPVRGGIPVCWPWFGAHEARPDLASHGLVRTRPWEVLSTASNANETALVLGIAEGREAIDGWPLGVNATLRVALGESLTVVLETHNAGPALLRLTCALHTYFAVRDIGNTSVDGLAGCAYLDKLGDGGTKHEVGTIRFDGELDRIYLGATSNIHLRDAGPPVRGIGIASEGSRSAVVWNPWIEKSARLGDMGAADAYRGMVCIETANAGDDVVELAPGGTHTLTARLTAGV